MVLPPSSIGAELGADLDNESWRTDSKNYWTMFYDADFQKGLAYWNSLLCWLTRRAPLELNLQGAASGQHTVYDGASTLMLGIRMSILPLQARPSLWAAPSLCAVWLALGLCFTSMIFNRSQESEVLACETRALLTPDFSA
ncbi:hypothetical protein HC891_15710 [Candidatus Gracilibacteria bacterium]|nr:hypothetical protein [Candidatus Gracilibacteria bacterium]